MNKYKHTISIRTHNRKILILETTPNGPPVCCYLHIHFHLSPFQKQSLKEDVQIQNNPTRHRDDCKDMNPEQDSCSFPPTPS